MKVLEISSFSTYFGKKNLIVKIRHCSCSIFMFEVDKISKLFEENIYKKPTHLRGWTLNKDLVEFTALRDLWESFQSLEHFWLHIVLGLVKITNLKLRIIAITNNSQKKDLANDHKSSKKKTVLTRITQEVCCWPVTDFLSFFF